MTKKKQQKPVQQKGSHDDKRKADTLIPPTTQPTMKMINQNDLLQYCSPPDSNYISTASCALQIDEEKEQKNLYQTLVILDIVQDYYPLTNPTEIKMGIDFCQGGNPEQEPMKIDTDTKDPDRFNPKQNTDDNRNIRYYDYDENSLGY